MNADSIRPALSYGGQALAFISGAGNLTDAVGGGQLNVYRRGNPFDAVLGYGSGFE